MNRGFTLLEVMVAVAILAIALTTLLGSQSQSMFAAEASDFSSRSALLARTKMAEILIAGEQPGSSSGDFGEHYPGYAWKLEISEPDFSESELLTGMAGLLRRIELTVHNENERRFFVLTRVVLKGERR